MAEVYVIGDRRFDAKASRVVGPDGEARLEHRSARVLEVLCRRRGEVVSQQELLTEVWQGRIVSDNSVSIAIRDIRKALAEDARRPLHLTTIPKRGYRLNAEPIALEEPMPPEEPVPLGVRREPSTSKPRNTWLLGILASVMMLAAIPIWLNAGSTPSLLLLPTQNRTGSHAYDPLARALDEVVLVKSSSISVFHVVSGTSGLAERRLQSTLTLWAGQPALSLTLVNVRDGRVLWSAMVEGQPSAMAGLTIAKLAELKTTTSR